jgi:hypothetical protein
MNIDDFLNPDDPDQEEEESGVSSLPLPDNEHETYLAGIAAKHMREAGVMPEVDEFSWEWHVQFDGEMEATAAAQAGDRGEGAGGGASGVDAADLGTTGDTGSGGVDSSGPGGSDAGTGSGSDFGSFGSDFGGGSGGGFS